MSFELFFDNEYNFDNVCIRQEKFRLYRCVDRKGNFLWWEWSGEDNIKRDENGLLFLDLEALNSVQNLQLYLTETTSGFADFTAEGTVLELTDEQKAKALTRKVKL